MSPQDEKSVIFTIISHWMHDFKMHKMHILLMALAQHCPPSRRPGLAVGGGGGAVSSGHWSVLPLGSGPTPGPKCIRLKKWSRTSAEPCFSAFSSKRKCTQIHWAQRDLQSRASELSSKEENSALCITLRIV